MKLEIFPSGRTREDLELIRHAQAHKRYVDSELKASQMKDIVGSHFYRALAAEHLQACQSINPFYIDIDLLETAQALVRNARIDSNWALLLNLKTIIHNYQTAVKSTREA